MAAWEDEPLGAFGSGANVPTGQWFDIDTDDRAVGHTDADDLASASGLHDAVHPSPPCPGWGEARSRPRRPLARWRADSLGDDHAGSMQRVQRLDQMGVRLPARQLGMV